MAGNPTTHCPKGHEYTEENTSVTNRTRLKADGTTSIDTMKRCKSCCREKARIERLTNPEKRRAAVNKSSKKRLKEIRLEGIKAYGGKCKCCGESTPEFLHFDHVNNDGADHRREVTGNPRGSGGSKTMLAWAKKNNWPDKLQLLCHNCGMADAWYGQCPHLRNEEI